MKMKQWMMDMQEDAVLLLETMPTEQAQIAFFQKHGDGQDQRHVFGEVQSTIEEHIAAQVRKMQNETIDGAELADELR